MYDETIRNLRNESKYALPSQTRKALIEAANVIEELEIVIAGLNEAVKGSVDDMPRWIPVTERLPEKNQIVVVVQRGKTWDYGQFRGLAYLGGNIHKWNWKNNTTKTVDYWMPKKSALPEPTEEE